MRTLLKAPSRKWDNVGIPMLRVSIIRASFLKASPVVVDLDRSCVRTIWEIEKSEQIEKIEKAKDAG